jgi:uncharacterized protein YecA (UPF0149 family)
MKNTCNYSDEWQPYIGDYDKFEYDIKLKDGTIVENCYPNGGKFNSISDEHDQHQFEEALVSEIRFSERPRFGLNAGVSSRPQYEWLERKRVETEMNFELCTPYSFPYMPHPMAVYDPYRFRSKWSRGKIVPVRTEPKISRNDTCPKCDSGKKYKHCCINN